jgi:hypothetical protein
MAVNRFFLQHLFSEGTAMRVTKSLVCLCAVAMSSCALLSQPAMADMIGLQGALGRWGTESFRMAPSDTAGVVAQDNWGSIVSLGGSGTGVQNSSGVEVPITISWSAPASYGVYNSTQTNDRALMNTFWDTSDQGGVVTFGVSGIPYAQYDLYAYVGSDGNGRTGHGELQGVAGSARYFLTSDNPFNGYVQATATTLGEATAANYVKFSGLTSSSFTFIESTDGAAGVGLHGIQIVDTTVPEPSVLTLIALGLVSLLAYAWRKRK